ncbi:Phosphatidylserine/phosphatidylglycerophosphate/cardiolipin synthase-like protein [Parafrankia sp. EAN1pec]|uniref:phospholipase D-like domain-containing protein n=1 Tax=Parafrankia sp. (strain EAN1pec) TaxID=298653 RepID=UPI00005445CB|nr:Phosphatidylserine/phosphatidylglycerophosphate/cardiolipin synthase-like protein [Frankia sp. EAN1pec]
MGDLEATFRERWDDPSALDNPNPIRQIFYRIRPVETNPDGLPPQAPDPAPVGPHAVQILRTYPRRRPHYPFARKGEQSIARAYRKVLRRARRLIYLEDQYMWSTEVARLFAYALRREPELHLVIVVPRFPTQGGRFSLPPNLVGREKALEICRAAGGDRVAVYDVENHAGTPVYVHSKAVTIDDVWASIGSDNLNRRSWSHDSELAVATIDTTLDPREPHDPGGLGDGARVFARDLRLELWREHLDWDGGGEELIDPEAGFQGVPAARRRARRLAPRRPGRARRAGSGRTGRNASAGSPAAGPRRSTMPSTTRTAVPAGCAATTPGDPPLPEVACGRAAWEEGPRGRAGVTPASPRGRRLRQRPLMTPRVPVGHPARAAPGA